MAKLCRDQGHIDVRNSRHCRQLSGLLYHEPSTMNFLQQQATAADLATRIWSADSQSRCKFEQSGGQCIWQRNSVRQKAGRYHNNIGWITTTHSLDSFSTGHGRRPDLIVTIPWVDLSDVELAKIEVRIISIKYLSSFNPFWEASAKIELFKSAKMKWLDWLSSIMSEWTETSWNLISMERSPSTTRSKT